VDAGTAVSAGSSSGKGLRSAADGSWGAGAEEDDFGAGGLASSSGKGLRSAADGSWGAGVVDGGGGDGLDESCCPHSTALHTSKKQQNRQRRMSLF